MTFCSAERVVDVARREPPRVEALRIDVDHDLALLAAVRPRDLRALDGRDVGADEVDAVVEELLLAERVALEREPAGWARSTRCSG